jgi:hypothetical protein
MAARTTLPYTASMRRRLAVSSIAVALMSACGLDLSGIGLGGGGDAGVVEAGGLDAASARDAESVDAAKDDAMPPSDGGDAAAMVDAGQRCALSLMTDANFANTGNWLLRGEAEFRGGGGGRSVRLHDTDNDNGPGAVFWGSAVPVRRLLSMSQKFRIKPGNEGRGYGVAFVWQVEGDGTPEVGASLGSTGACLGGLTNRRGHALILDTSANPLQLRIVKTADCVAVQTRPLAAVNVNTLVNDQDHVMLVDYDQVRGTMQVALDGVAAASFTGLPDLTPTNAVFVGVSASRPANGSVDEHSTREFFALTCAAVDQ